MADYYLNEETRDSGERVLHAEHCQYLPNPDNREHVGGFEDAGAAVAKAEDMAGDVKPCRTCCSEVA